MRFIAFDIRWGTAAGGMRLEWDEDGIGKGLDWMG